MEELRGKVAVVTGAASGIGLGLAKRFGAEGMKLVLADVDEPGLRAATDELRSAGAEVIGVRTDVSDGGDVEALLDATLDVFGAVHLVCNNAGVGIGGQITGLDVKDWEWALGVNLWGVIHGMRVFLPVLLEQDEGHIVNTASVAGLFATPFMAPYCATKYAVVAISECAYHELAMQGSQVGISVLCPAWVRTNIADSERSRPAHLQVERPGDAPGAPDLREVLREVIATGKDPSEVAQTVADAVRSKRFYVVTHRESLAAIEARMRAILDGGAPPLLMP
ncbi:SDR family NAD(P)-dependent oxidoreductase [Rhabdothermincola sediminis]|uniref:SDR family NAD(P)-dependent oxidoreductase n=1 Tax=Rhabdothermincola sediminis TaxID=2751370 RepID=UPI001AA05953|nr:SDR family NAD(P)-dependent oxidoreductase [Rhabdothermincola sediminis]